MYVEKKEIPYSSDSFRYPAKTKNRHVDFSLRHMITITHGAEQPDV